VGPNAGEALSSRPWLEMEVELTRVLLLKGGPSEVVVEHVSGERSLDLVAVLNFLRFLLLLLGVDVLARGLGLGGGSGDSLASSVLSQLQSLFA